MLFLCNISASYHTKNINNSKVRLEFPFNNILSTLYSIYIVYSYHFLFIDKITFKSIKICRLAPINMVYYDLEFIPVSASSFAPLIINRTYQAKEKDDSK